MWCEFIGNKCLEEKCKQYKQGEYCEWERGGLENLTEQVLQELPPLSELIEALEKE